MKKYIYSVLVFCFLMTGSFRAGTQVVYGSYTFLGTTYLAAIDVATCTACNVFEIPNEPHSNVSILPDGRVIFVGTQGQSQISVFTPPSSTPTYFSLNPPSFMTGSVFYNNQLYLSATNGLYYFDPAANQTFFVGPWPAGFPNGVYLYELGGLVYAISIGIPSEIWQVDLNNPSNSVFFQSTSFTNTIAGITSINNEVFFATAFWINSYDPTSNTYEQECNAFAMGLNGFQGLTSLPPGTPPFSCLCTTDAGTVNNGTAEICLPDAATVPFNNDETLDSDDLLQYILFSDLTDNLGSILATSSTPNIAFNPATMQTGVTYYLATIAGDNLNGNVDLNDDCLSISNASEVIWHPQPSVSFAAPNPDVCVGGCITLEVTLTGTPPFGLTGEILTGANVVGTFNENFLQNNGTLNACAPLGTAPGSLSVQAVTLSDANCSCL